MASDYRRRLPGAKLTKSMEKAAGFFEISKDFLAGSVKITILGDNDICFEGKLFIIEYSECILRVAVSTFIITITGSNFEVTEVDTDFLRLGGEISSITYMK